VVAGPAHAGRPAAPQLLGGTKCGMQANGEEEKTTDILAQKVLLMQNQGQPHHHHPHPIKDKSSRKSSSSIGKNKLDFL